LPDFDQLLEEANDQLFERIEQPAPHTVPVTSTAIGSITEL